MASFALLTLAYFAYPQFLPGNIYTSIRFPNLQNASFIA